MWRYSRTSRSQTPPPSSLKEIVRADPGAGEPGRSVVVTVKVPLELVREIDRLAGELGATRSQLVRAGLALLLELASREK